MQQEISVAKLQKEKYLIELRKKTFFCNFEEFLAKKNFKQFQNNFFEGKIKQTKQLFGLNKLKRIKINYKIIKLWFLCKIKLKKHKID